MSGSPFPEATAGLDGAADHRLADPQEMLSDDEEALDSLLDTGYSPPERPLRNAFDHEDLDERLACEEPEIWTGDDTDQRGDGIGDSADSDGEPYDEEVGGRRAGRLVAPSEGAHSDHEPELYATDVGIDGGAASAEEAAIHVIVPGDD